MLSVEINAIASDVKTQYKVFTAALVGLFGKAIDASDPTTSRARSAYHSAQRDLATSFGESVVGMVGREIDHIARLHSHELTPDDANSLREHLSGLKDEFEATLQVYLARNVATGMAALRNFSLNVELTRASGVGRLTSIIRARHGATRSLTFKVEDRIGRMWSSDQLVYMTTRGCLVTAHTEAALFSISKRVGDLAVINYPGNQNDGLIFSITGTTDGYPSYSDIREEVFHPQSEASVTEI